jgi:acyl-coenzyme A synthetase/AMP-(fatty) acid ligase
VIELRPGADATADAILAFVRERVGAVKTPKTLVFTDALPRSTAGKVLRAELRGPYWQGRERTI